MVNKFPSETRSAAPTPGPRALKSPPASPATSRPDTPSPVGKPIPIPVIPVESSLATRIGIVAASVCAGLAALAVGIVLFPSGSPTADAADAPAPKSDAPTALAAVDKTLDEAKTPTTQGQRSSNQPGQVTAPETTTTTIETAEDRARVDTFRIAAEGTMDRLGDIENHTIRELGEGMCSVASGVMSPDGFRIMAELIWVGMGQDTRATYFNDSENFISSSRLALPIYCPNLSESLFPDQTSG